MTVAVCLECGTLKTGAWSACPICGYQPAGEEQLAQSLLVSDNWIARKDLEAMANRRRQGEPWKFDEQLLEVVKGRLATLIPMNPEARPVARTDSYQQGQAIGPSFRKPWWQFWKRIFG
jgi:hypothetical protein